MRDRVVVGQILGRADVRDQARATISPGTMVRKGMKIFGNAPISGVRSRPSRFFADSARCTSAKFVVQ